MASTSAPTIGQKDFGDYISLLPDCLIHHIFSFLPTRDVVKTCVLSKRWQSVWTAISDLKVLTLYRWRKVIKFHLDIRSKYFYPFKIDSWVRFAIDHEVEELLRNMNWSARYTLSPLLYNCSSLTKLCLSGFDDVLRKNFMGSPVLEYLNLKGFWGLERIRSTNLKELVIDDINVEVPLETFSPPSEIWTPCLLSLRESLGRLQNATRIQLGAWYVWVMGLLKVEDVQFLLPNCKSLTLHMLIPQFSFPAIANMLATTPNLEKLVIIFDPPDCVSVCSLNYSSRFGNFSKV
ncbi:hypothetical protein BT93_H0848 [Corymbia citriodora subsp. variegata]|nr:hypothetical protein BT93_H0848 [Corymbia citriodora subsp. variegata]